MAKVWRTMRQFSSGSPEYDGLIIRSFLASPFVFSSSLPRSSSSSSFSSSSSSSPLPRLTLFTHDNCSLCDEALEQISHLKGRFAFESVDILHPDHKKWKKLYRYDIPVFHFDGEFLMKHRADVALLESRLDEFDERAKGNADGS